MRSTLNDLINVACASPAASIPRPYTTSRALGSLRLLPFSRATVVGVCTLPHPHYTHTTLPPPHAHHTTPHLPPHLYVLRRFTLLRTPHTHCAPRAFSWARLSIMEQHDSTDHSTTRVAHSAHAACAIASHFAVAVVNRGFCIGDKRTRRCVYLVCCADVPVITLQLSYDISCCCARQYDSAPCSVIR